MLNKLLIFLALSSNICFAEGRLQTRYSLINTKDYSYYSSNPEFGLAINEPLRGLFEYQSWTSYNYRAYLTTEHYALISFFDEFKIGMGPAYGMSLDGSNKNNVNLKVILDVKLWN